GRARGPHGPARGRRAGQGRGRAGPARGDRRRGGGVSMDIDISVLHQLEREREIKFDVLVAAIEQALLSAYQRTPGAHPRARVELDRKSGHVTVWAVSAEDAEAGNPVEFADTPEGFGRVATATARQVIVQRLRDAEDDQVLGMFRDKEG